MDANIITDLKTARINYLYKTKQCELHLKEEFKGLIKVTVMLQSLDLYLDFPDDTLAIDDVADKLGGTASGVYHRKDSKKVTYCISLLPNNNWVVF